MTLFSRSVAKYVRRQKALIRKATEGKDEQKRLIRDLVARLKK